jgi:hypothetical protein
MCVGEGAIGGRGWSMGSVWSTVTTGLWRVCLADKVRGRGEVGQCWVGTMLVRVLIVGMPLVYGALVRHRGSNQQAGAARSGVQWWQHVGTQERAAWYEKSYSCIGRGAANGRG